MKFKFDKNEFLGYLLLLHLVIWFLVLLFLFDSIIMVVLTPYVPMEYLAKLPHPVFSIFQYTADSMGMRQGIINGIAIYVSSISFVLFSNYLGFRYYSHMALEYSSIFNRLGYVFQLMKASNLYLGIAFVILAIVLIVTSSWM